MEVILDTNFIVSCVRRKIDFLAELENLGFKILIPREVLQELKDIRIKVPRDDKTAIDVALELIAKSKGVKKVGFGVGKVDEEIIRYGKRGIYVASLDSYVKRSVPSRVIINSAGNNLVVERD